MKCCEVNSRHFRRKTRLKIHHHKRQFPLQHTTYRWPMYCRSVHRNKYISVARIEIRSGCKLLPGSTRHRKPFSVAARSQQLSIRVTEKYENLVKLVFLTLRNCLILCTHTWHIFILYWQFMISSLSLSIISYDVTTKNFVFDRLAFSSWYFS